MAQLEFDDTSWTQPAAIFAPFLSEEQTEYANYGITVLFVGVLLVLLRRAVGTGPLLQFFCGGSCSLRCFSCMYRVFLFVRTFVVCWWIYFLRAYGEWLRPIRPCKVVVIGDGLALGFGDFVTFYSKQAGVTRRFQKVLDNAAVSRSVFLPWRVYNRGHFASTSEEWDPSCSRLPRFHSIILRRGAKNLFEHTFGPASVVADAQVVVMMLGTMDARVPPGHPGRTLKYTVGHIENIVRELERRGKFVILCQLHDARWADDVAAQQGYIGVHHLKNTAMMSLCQELPERVAEGANFTHVDYHSHRHADSVHFCSTGYQLAAKEMLSTLIRQCRRAENAIAGQTKGGAQPRSEKKKDL